MEARFEDIVVGARGGEPWAVSQLWRRFNPDLLRFLRGRAPGSVDDVASETWIRVGRAIVRFDGSEADFRAWFFTIARRALIDWQRKERRRATVAVEDPVFDAMTSHTDTANIAIERIATDAALRLVATLPADQADVVLLRVVAGLSADRVAAILGKSAGSVRVLQHRGLRRLAEQLAADPRRVDRVTP